MATSATVCRSNFIYHPFRLSRRPAYSESASSARRRLGSRLVGSEADFDRYIAEHNIPEEEWPEAFARWIAEHTGGPVPRFEKVEPGDEQILEDREQRDPGRGSLAPRAARRRGRRPLAAPFRRFSCRGTRRT
jgi:hypothetical protein